MNDPREQKEAFDRGVRSRIAANVVLVSVLAILLVVFLNYGMNQLGTQRDLRFDITSTKAAGLQETTRDFVRGIDDSIQVYLVFGVDDHMRSKARKTKADRSFDTGFIDRYYRPVLKTMLDQFQLSMSEVTAVNPRVRARVINSEVERDAPVTIQRDLGMGPGQMLNHVVFYNRRTKAKKAISLYHFFELDLGGPDETIGFQQPALSGEVVESRLLVGLRSVMERTKMRIGVATGHGERPLRSVNEILQSDNFEVLAVELNGDQPKVPAGCDLLLIFSPSRPWPKPALDEVLRFLDDGGRIFVSQGADTQENFTSLLERVGLKPKAVQVGHEAKSAGQRGIYWLYGSDLLRPIRGKPHTIVEAVVRERLPIEFGRSRAYEFLEDFERDRVTRQTLVHSTDGATAMPWLFDGKLWRQAPEAGVTKGDFPLVVAIEVARGKGQEPGRLVVAGGDDWLNEGPLRRRVEAGNLDVFMNSVYWLTDTEQLIMATPRRFRGALVDLGDGRAKSFRLLTVAIVPGLILLAGALMFFWRRR